MLNALSPFNPLSRLGTAQLLGAAAALLGLGLVMVYSASAVRGQLALQSPATYLGRQLGGIAIGVPAALLVFRLPPRWLRALSPIAWLVGVACLVATLTPFGVEQNRATRWLSLGGFVFQPLEPMKLALVLALATWLSDNEKRLSDPRVSIAVPVVLAGIPAGLLLLQPDFGGAVTLVLFAAVLSFAAGARPLHLALTATATLPVLAVIAALEPYRLERLKAFVCPWCKPTGQGYQLVQSLLAFGAGGILGTGLGAGQQKLGYLPEAHTDFILSVVGEELGFVGVAGVLSLFALLGVSALAIAARARDAFTCLIAVGASLLLWLQGIVNAGVAMGMLPTKGTTLPLFSYGRSSLVISLVAIGLVLNVARPTRAGARRSAWR